MDKDDNPTAIHQSPAKCFHESVHFKVPSYISTHKSASTCLWTCASTDMYSHTVFNYQNWIQYPITHSFPMPLLPEHKNPRYYSGDIREIKFHSVQKLSSILRSFSLLSAINDYQIIG